MITTALGSACFTCLAAASVAVANDPGNSYNPLFLYGGVGLGKTHLMHAIAWEIRKRHPQRRVVYLSAEMFMYRFIRALRFKDMMSFKEQLRSVDVLMIDDVQFISGKDSTQEEFFHTFNALVDQNKQIVLSADKSPSDLEGVEERTAELTQQIAERGGFEICIAPNASVWNTRSTAQNTKRGMLPSDESSPRCRLKRRRNWPSRSFGNRAARRWKACRITGRG